MELEMSLRHFWSFPIAAMILISGCIPIREELPFGVDALAFIEVGVTDREAIESRFGKPDATRADSSMSIYDRTRMTGLLVSHVGVREMATEHLLVVRYGADDLVQHYEVFRVGSDWTGYEEVCTTDMLCVDVASAGVVVFDHPDKDSKAKLFDLDEERCLVYLYSTQSGPGHSHAHVCPVEDESRSYCIDEGGYIYWKARPGPMTVGAYAEHETSGSCSIEYEFECKAAHRYFIHVHKKHHFWGSPTVTISADEAEAGRKLVSERRLMLR